MKTSARTVLWRKRKKSVVKRLARSNRPMLKVYRSGKHIYAQLADAQTGLTLTAASTLSPSVRSEVKTANGKDSAKKVGQAIAKLALDRNITEVTFNRNGFVYTGRVKALADAAREAGLKF